MNVKIQNEILHKIADSVDKVDATVSIGRNIGKHPMSATEWDRFKADIMDLIDIAEADIHFTGEGLGIYKGATEPSFTVTFTTTQEHIGKIKELLGVIAYRYNQEAIAMTTGRTILYEARMGAYANNR